MKGGGRDRWQPKNKKKNKSFLARASACASAVQRCEDGGHARGGGGGGVNKHRRVRSVAVQLRGIEKKRRRGIFHEISEEPFTYK